MWRVLGIFQIEGAVREAWGWGGLSLVKKNAQVAGAGVACQRVGCGLLPAGRRLSGETACAARRRGLLSGRGRWSLWAFSASFCGAALSD